MALSSMYLTWGISPRTVKGAKIMDTKKGVPSQIVHPIHMKYEQTNPTFITVMVTSYGTSNNSNFQINITPVYT